MAAEKLVGQPIKRKEDPRLITGTATYVDDVNLPGMVHAAILRSIHGHARIRRIDVAAARGHPGVLAVVTGEEVRAHIRPIPCAAQMPDLKMPEHPVLALGKVRYVGEPVAAVVAVDRYTARDALDLIAVDYEPLPAAVDPEQALKPGAPILHEQWTDNRAYTWNLSGGDVDRAFGEAQVVIRQRMVNQRLAPMAMEARGVVAQYHPGDDALTVWSSTQIPHLLRTLLAGMLGLAENRIRVIAPEVGGAFGSKLNVYAEEAIVAYLAKRLGRPVKWIEGRRENFQTTTHGRDQIDDLEIAASKEGKVLGLRLRIVADLGAYHQLLTPIIPTLTGVMLNGCYDIPNLQVELIGVFTDKMATDAYRGAGRPEATYLIERAMDLVAREVGLDPAEVRRRNFIQRFPFQTVTGLNYDSGNYEAPLEKALELVQYEKLREEQRRAREQGRYLGIGLATYVEICAMGPSSGMPAGGWESATVRVEPTGKATVLTGASPHGQGQETSFAQLAADELGIPYDDVVVLHGDTQTVQYGIGTFGSRATAVGGTAVLLALRKVKQKATTLAAHLLKADPGEVVFEGGQFMVAGAPEKTLSMAQVADAAHHAKSIPPDFEPGLSATTFFEPSNYTFPFGTHVAVVEVDPETGEVKFLRYVAVDDCGRVLNPMLVDGQIHGGIAQGLGQALMEELVYDETGQLVTGTLMDYAIPKAKDVPPFLTARLETPSPVNPMGLKGVGEAGTIGSTPAIVNAVVDALAALGVKHIDMPLKPERVWRAIRAAPRPA